MRAPLLLAVAGSTLLLAVAALAQPASTPNPAANPPLSASRPAGLELTPEQRQLIVTSISSKTSQSTAAPPTFHPNVGATVPTSVEVAPMPDTLTQVVPRLKGYEFAMVAGQVLIIDPQSKQIVEVIVR
jgi:Protein of unknown function (DUF1236)